jgi:nifR3 family TIM-barrel protein
MNSIQYLLAQYDFPLYLAPMEGVTDSVFRKLCKEQGATLLISEFVSSDALIRNVAQSLNKISFNDSERPFGVQIFGNSEENLTMAAQKAEEIQPDFIDINWGCPVKKIVSKGAGAAILQDIPKMIRLTKAVVNNVNIPVTVKTRLGWDETYKPIVEVAEKLQDIGVSAITVHGRTRSQLYSGTADWNLIGETKANPRLHIPVIGNGDIDSGEKAVAYKNKYGVDAVMIGRSAVGNPWIFREVMNVYHKKTTDIPTYKERVTMCIRHLQDTAELKGERRAILEMRYHYSGYFRGIPHFKEKKMRLMRATSIEECKDILYA